MSQPDFARLKEISAEMRELIDAGKWTAEEYERLLEEADKASGGNPEFIEFVVNRGVHFD